MSDDWIILWGISQQSTTFFNPLTVNFHGTSSIVARDGLFKIWYLSIIYHKFGLDPYIFHFFGLLNLLISSLALAWCGWKLTEKLYIGIFAGIFFSVTFLGSQSLYWIHNNVNYLLIAAIAFSLPLILKSSLRSLKGIALSIGIILMTIFIHPARAHGIMAFPLLIYIWNRRSSNRKVLLKAFFILFCIIAFYKLITLDISATENYNLTIGRMIGMSTHGINDLHWSAFLTFPFFIAVFTLPVEFWLGIPKSQDILLATLEFTLIWVLAIKFLYSLSKNLKRSLFWAAIGLLWIFLNFLVRPSLNYLPDWEWSTHFTLILSVLLIIFTLSSYDLLNKIEKWSSIVKTLLVMLILIFSSYIFSWMFDPLIHPNSNYSIGRYSTLPAAFGTLFTATIIGWMIAASIDKFKNSSKSLNSYTKVIRLFLGIFFALGLFYYILQVKIVQTRLEIDSLSLFKSDRNVQNILNQVSSQVQWGYPPPVIFISATKWDYGEVFGIFMWNGHSLALKNNINDFKKFPAILFVDEDKINIEINKYCNKYDNSPVNFYWFDIEKDRAINLTSSKIKVSCETRKVL